MTAAVVRSSFSIMVVSSRCYLYHASRGLSRGNSASGRPHRSPLAKRPGGLASQRRQHRDGGGQNPQGYPMNHRSSSGW
jgi:hypothetical protein